MANPIYVAPWEIKAPTTQLDTSHTSPSGGPNLTSFPYTAPVTDFVNRADQSSQGAGAGVLKNIEDWNKGKVSQDVLDQLSHYAAERGTGGGFGVDSPNTGAAAMRAALLTSQGQQEKGAAAYNQYAQTELQRQQLEYQYWAKQKELEMQQKALERSYYALNGPTYRTSGTVMPSRNIGGYGYIPQSTRDMSWFYQQPTTTTSTGYSYAPPSNTQDYSDLGDYLDFASYLGDYGYA